MPPGRRHPMPMTATGVTGVALAVGVFTLGEELAVPERSTRSLVAPNESIPPPHWERLSKPCLCCVDASRGILSAPRDAHVWSSAVLHRVCTVGHRCCLGAGSAGTVTRAAWHRQVRTTFIGMPLFRQRRKHTRPRNWCFLAVRRCCPRYPDGRD